MTFFERRIREHIVDQAIEKINKVASRYGMKKQDVIDLGVFFMIAYKETKVAPKRTDPISPPDPLQPRGW